MKSEWVWCTRGWKSIQTLASQLTETYDKKQCHNLAKWKWIPSLNNMYHLKARPTKENDLKAMPQSLVLVQRSMYHLKAWPTKENKLNNMNLTYRIYIIVCIHFTSPCRTQKKVSEQSHSIDPSETFPSVKNQPIQLVEKLTCLPHQKPETLFLHC